MNLYNVETRFDDGTKNVLVGAEDVHDAAYKINNLYAPDPTFLYVCDVTEVDDTPGMGVYFDDDVPAPKSFMVKVSTPYGTKYHCIVAPHWQTARDITEATYTIAKRPGHVVKITKTANLPIAK